MNIGTIRRALNGLARDGITRDRRSLLAENGRLEVMVTRLETENGRQQLELRKFYRYYHLDDGKGWHCYELLPTPEEVKQKRIEAARRGVEQSRMILRLQVQIRDLMILCGDNLSNAVHDEVDALLVEAEALEG